MNRYIFNRLQTARAVVTVLFLGLTFQAVALEMGNRTLRYSVSYVNQDAGELEIIIRRDGDQVKTTAISHLSDLAKMFLSGLTAETFFSTNGDSLQLDRGHLLSHDGSSIRTSFDIDRESGALVFVPEKQADGVKPGDVFDSTTFPLVLVSSDIKSIEGMKIREISTKRVSTYVYLAPTREMLELNGETFDTWKIVRHKPGDPERTVTIWLDRNDHQVPLRIVTIKNRKATEFSLISRS